MPTMQSVLTAITIGLILGFSCLGMIATAQTIRDIVQGHRSATCLQVLQ